MLTVSFIINNLESHWHEVYSFELGGKQGCVFFELGRKTVHVISDWPNKSTIPSYPLPSPHQSFYANPRHSVARALYHHHQNTATSCVSRTTAYVVASDRDPP